MSNDAPSPLTPADLDLSALEYMPLHVARLRKSVAWVKARRQPEIGFYMLNLWTAAWHETPAASLPDDDDILADAAMCEARRWPKVKDAAMRGFVLCGDGRWYHPFVAKEALVALNRRQKWRRQKQDQRADSDECPRGHGGGQAEDMGVENALRDGTGRDHKKEEVETPSPGAAREDDVGCDLPAENQDAAAVLTRPPSNNRGGGARTPGDVLAKFMRSTGPPEKRLKRQDRADQDMVRHLTTRGGMDTARAWTLVMAARDDDDPHHVEAARELEKISAKHKLGFFVEEPA